MAPLDYILLAACCLAMSLNCTECIFSSLQIIYKVYKMSIIKNKKDSFLSREFGQRLKSARKELGLTVDDVCVLLDVKRNSYYKYEHGARFPKFDVALSIMDNLGVSFNYLMTGNGEMFLDREPVLTGGCQLVQEPRPVYGEFTDQVSDMLYYIRNSTCVKLAVLKFFREYRYEKADMIAAELRKVAAGGLRPAEEKKKG